MERRHILSIFLILVLFTVSCGDSKGGIDSTASSFEYLTEGEGEWTVKIDDISVLQDVFNKDAVAFLTLSGAQESEIAVTKDNNGFKQQYADKVINDILLLRKAQEDKFFETEEAKAIIDASIRNLKVQYYTTTLIMEASKNIPDPTEDQAKAFFDQTRAQLAQQVNITEFNTETRPAINQLYKRAFAEQLIQRDLSDLKDKSIIERNEAIIGVPSLLPAPLQQGGATGVPQNQMLPRGGNSTN